MITAETLARITIFLLYVPVCAIAYWRLIPRLTPSAKKLATIMLAAQALAIALSLENQPGSRPEYRFWNVDYENSLPAALATAQLALVSVVALLTAWCARGLIAWRRYLLAAIGVVFLFLALEEYLSLRDQVPGTNWEYYIALVGAAVAVAIVVLAAGLTGRARRWHYCLLAGLAMAGFGALVVEQFRFPEICATLGFMPEAGRCLTYYVEEALELLGVWLALVAMLGMFSDSTPAPRWRVRLLLYLLPLAIFCLLVLVSPNRRAGFAGMQRDITYTLSTLPLRLEYQFLVREISVEYESNIELSAYAIEQRDKHLELRFFASAARWRDFSGMGYSLHLVDQVSGESIVGSDESASRQHGFRFDSPSRFYYRQGITVRIPPQTLANRALWIVLTVWRTYEDEYLPLRIVSNDHALLNETQLILEELVIPAEGADPETAPLAAFDGALTLGLVDLPEHARPGESLAIAFNWRADNDVAEDYIQFLHFGDEATGDWWVYDQQPLGARLPTRLWYSGLVDSEVWQAPLPADLAPGRYQVFTGLYRLADSARLPARDVEGAPFPDARVPLGVLTLE